MTMWNPNDFTVEVLVEKIINKEITVPEYQRGQVWSDEKEKNLIDSIKNGYPFGAILLFCDEGGRFHLIDGLQRCTALYRYSTNPAQFFDGKTDIDDQLIDLIFDLTGFKANADKTKEKIRELIGDWIKKNNKNIADIKNINHSIVEEYIKEGFPSINGTISSAPSGERLKLNTLLHTYFRSYSDKCSNISKTKIPTIIYSGSKDNLPEVFSRINSNGTILSKYQILASTWNYEKVKIGDQCFDPILEYVMKFYQSIEKSGFTLTTDYNNLMTTREINLYQLLFGFGKMIKSKYPLLFGEFKEKDKNDKTESLAFNLINACLVNRNSKLSELPSIFRDCELYGEKLDKFLSNVLQTIDEVDRLFKPYLGFKLNSRKFKPVIIPPEMQISSVIANLFILKYVEVVKDESTVLNRLINFSIIKSRKSELNLFKQSCFKIFLIDVLNGKWKGTGDKSLDEVSSDLTYYNRHLTKPQMRTVLDSWFFSSNENKREHDSIASPNDAEKLLLSIIYVNKFTAAAHLDQSKYDIEHLCTKKLMKTKIHKFGDSFKLPISSFGNICILPEWDNRSKKDNILYDDESYLKSLGERIRIIENDFSFTSKEYFTFLRDDELSSEEFKNSYSIFLANRFERQKEIIVDRLLPE